MCERKGAIRWWLNNDMGGNIITHENSDGPYSLILQTVAIPHIRTYREMVLMQDNATPHTARTTQQMIQGHKIRLLR